MRSRLAILVCTVAASTCAKAGEADSLDTVTVVGQREGAAVGSRLGLGIREIPASVEVIDARTMAQRGDSTVLRAVTKATGIVGGASGHGTAGNYSVRGFTGYPGIDFLQDGIKLNGTIFSKRSLDVASLDRIEIIRGAASVLNGEGSVGATVNLVSKTPGFGEEETESGMRIGSHDSYRVHAARAGVAIEDKLAYRIDGVTRRVGTNYHGERRQLDSLSAALRYRAGQDLVTSLSVEKTRDDGVHDYQGTPLVDGKLDRRVQDINYNNLVDGVDAGSSLWIRHGIEWNPNARIAVKNRLYYQRADAQVRRLYLAVQDTANRGMVNRRGYDSMQEQRLIGNRLDLTTRGDVFGLANRLLAGVDVSSLALHREQSTYAGKIIATPMFDPAVRRYQDFFNAGVDDYRKSDADIDLKQIAVYAEDQLSLTDKLKLVAGIRYDRYDIDYDFKKGLSSPIDQEINKKHNKLSYRTGLVLDLNDATNLYASYASSFEPGDASASFLTVSAAQTRLELTRARQFEIGVKHTFLGGKADLAASAYIINKKNLFASNPTPGAGLLNVGEQSAKGIEIAMGVRPVEQVQVEANYSHVDAKYDDFVHNGKDYSGMTPSSVPRHVANVGLRYTPMAALGIGAWVKNVGAMQTDHVGFANSVKLPAYTTVDLTLDYVIGKNMTASVLLKNLTDELYATTARRDTQVFLGEARALEIGLTYRF